jgi:hypothetical protein
MRRSLAGRALVLATLGLTASAAPAAASVTVGQTAPGATVACFANFDRLQFAVSSGNSYIVPATDGITSWTVKSWSTKASATGGELTLKIFRRVSDLTYTVVGHDGPRVTAANTLNTFPVAGNLLVKPGDYVGLHDVTDNQGCTFAGTGGDVRHVRSGNLGDGESGSFLSFTGERVNISALLDPTNTLTLAGTKVNKKKGTATIRVDVPNPGQLVLSGNGVKTGTARAAGPGPVKLTVRARGKKKRKLRAKGKVKLAPRVTYTPTGGAANTLSTALKLKKKTKKKG